MTTKDPSATGGDQSSGQQTKPPDSEPPAQLNIQGHESPGTWLQEMRARGFMVPLPLCHGVSQAMERLSLSFAEAFRLLWKNGKILLTDRVLIYDLSARKLWEGGDNLEQGKSVKG